MDINQMKVAIEKAKTDRTVAITNEKNYTEQLQKKDEEIRALNVDPEQIDAVIAELDAQIEADKPVVEAMIPAKYKVGM